MRYACAVRARRQRPCSGGAEPASCMKPPSISCATHGQHLDIEDTYDDLEEGESLPQEYTDEVVTVARVVRQVEDVFPG